MVKEEEKGAPRWAVDDGGVATGIGGRGNGNSDTVGAARRWWPLSESRRRGPNTVGPRFGLGG
jgi:hypothetical protein